MTYHIKAEVKSLKIELSANKVDSNSDRQSDKHMRQQGCFQKQLNEYREAEREKLYNFLSFKCFVLMFCSLSCYDFK